MGLNAAHSNYACLYCDIKKDKRYNKVHATHINYGHYIDIRYDTDAVTKKRTLDTICEHARSGAYGVIHQPLIKIDVDKVYTADTENQNYDSTFFMQIVDELHLLLCISDVLIRNIVTAAATADASIINKDETKQTEKLLESIRECGITFRVSTIHINCKMINSQIWHSKDNKKELQWTSLRGVDRKKLLLKLPPFIPEIVPNDIREDIQRLWKVQCIQ